MMETNKIILGDCIDVLKDYPDKCIDLIYVDPPFYTQKTQKKHSVIITDLKFEDKFETLDNYLMWLKKRCLQFHRILKPTGSFYLHCDYRAGHYIKVMLDDIFGYNNFRNEIVWCFINSGLSNKQFKRRHNTIFFYSKTKDHIFNVLRNTNHPLVGVDITFKKPFLSLHKTKVHPIVIYEGPALSDWWSDIHSFGVVTKGKEITGYPTQKPEKLLDRIIRASSNENDIVLDPMCGSGTTCYVAEQLNRKWIGIDSNQQAIDISKKRLKFVVPKIPKDKLSKWF